MGDSYMKLCVDRNVIVVDSSLYEALCRNRPELLLKVGYMKLCVDRDLKCG
jgi:hypothetical protein